jgi:hypothetical protein
MRRLTFAILFALALLLVSYGGCQFGAHIATEREEQ